MEVTVSGRPRFVSVELCTLALETFSEYLLGLRIAKNVHVTLSFKSRLGHFLGHVEPIEFTRRFRDFDITVQSSLKKKSMLRILGHEMVHLKQYAVDEMRDISSSRVRWKGEIFPYNNDKVDLEYWLSPWEREALGYEEGLLQLFLSKYKDVR